MRRMRYFGFLGGKENPDEAELDRYIEVLQAEEQNGVRKEENGTPEASPTEMDQPNEVTLG